MAKMSALKNVFLLLSQVATGLGLCTLVAEDDILVSSPVLCFLIGPCHITSFVLQKMCWKLYICTSGCARHHGVLRELVHAVLREAGRYLSFDQSPDESAAHQRSALLGSAADHLLRQSNQRNTTKVRHFTHSYLPIFGGFFCHVLLFNTHFVVRRFLPKLPRLLESDDVNMRIAAGETISLLFELARDMDPVSSVQRNPFIF